ncbi:MAG: AAA-like domain-containing protein [Cyanobacteriota bacterium]|jgi:hypothetical protein
MENRPVRTILFLAANPNNSTQLRLGEEAREIDEGLTRSKQREQFKLEQKWAVRPKDIQRAMLDLSPQFVHFSGHGMGTETAGDSAEAGRKMVAEVENPAPLEGLVFENETGQAQLVSKEALAGLFELFADQLECVLLNACYSEIQAEAIAAHIPYVIGMNRAIGDKAARVFAVGFYDALGAGKDIEFAYKFACNSIRMEGIPEHLTPVLKRRSDLRQSQPIASSATEMINDSDFYIAFPYENRCYQEIQKPGSLIRIKSPDKMGKSTLMARILAHSEKLSYRTVSLDLAQTNQRFFNDIDKFMQWFCASVGKPLEIRVKIEEYWDDIFGANDNSTDYFEKYLLQEDSSPLILAIDDFDRIFQYPDIETDLCGLLRGWHESSKTKKKWEKLRLIIVHSQESYAQRDINQSPFNVGLPIELEEFTSSQVEELVRRHGLNWQASDIQQLMSLIGGHPYLVRSALYSIATEGLSLTEFLRTAPTEAGIYGDYLRGHLKTLEDYPELGTAMKAVVNAEQPIRLRSEEGFKLDAMGLVVRVENNVKPRCELYRHYFKALLGG